MNVVVDINGRKAIPVRAIPFLTDWTVLCPEVLVASLSLKGMAGEIHGLTAYRLEGDIVVPIKSSWWVDTAAAIDSLTETSNAKNLAYSDWQRATIQALPDSSFVWRDEFEERFHHSFLDDDGATSDHFVNLKPAILGLDFSPLMSAEMNTMVMHGFQSDGYDQTDASPPTATSIDSADDTKPSLNTATPATVKDLDDSLLATPAKLLDAFRQWGMKAAWFDDLNSRQWLLDARRKKGQGQRGHVIEPLFCPFAVMNGLIGKVRKATRLQPDAAWRTLEHKFPKVHATFESYDPRERTGD